MTTIVVRLAAGTPQILLAVVIVLAVTFLAALAIAVRGTAPEQRATVLRAFAHILPVRRR
ncbi:MULTISPECIES: hypothetical protein [Streptomyces]|uniref:hypothetical protein n=1 Tax=Streptomyces TaxID=1883 RepID=UPI0006EB4B74|nr:MULTISPECIES: hypothetical protein [Streptomyces]MCF3124446.1 hypothetical protein [Streptomyces arenae]